MPSTNVTSTLTTTPAGSGLGAGSGPGPGSGASTSAVPGHVFVVVMENLSYQDALATTGFAQLAHRYAYLSDYYAASHPSLPNYLALTAGTTFGITSDCLSCYVSSDNLGNQLSAAHFSWGAYMEGVSQACYLGTSYALYAAKHNPFRYYTAIRQSASLCAHLRPLPDLFGALEGGASAVPELTWVTPNICDDGHDCAPSQAAAWLESFLARVTSSRAWKNGGTCYVVWDEGNGGDTAGILPSGAVQPTGGGGHVLALVLTPHLRPGTVIHVPLDHYGLLATIEQHFGLSFLGQAASWRGHTLQGVGAG